MSQSADDIPLYEANSSSSDSESEEDQSIPSTLSSRSVSLPFAPSLTSLEQQRQQQQQQQQTSTLLGRSNSVSKNDNNESKYVCSQFTPNDDNTIFGSNYVVFGLKANQTLLIRGQYEMEVQRGAIMVNHCMYYSSRSKLKFISPICNALPLIKAAQVRDVNEVDDLKTKENEHLFSSDYKSVIKCYHLSSGLEKVGQIAPLFKNLFWNLDSLSNDELKALNSFEMGFNHSFSPVLAPTNQVSILSHSQYSAFLQTVSQLRQNNELLKILIIGGKNSGKSTLLNLTLQTLHKESSEDNTVNVLDIDPGQTYLSPPDSISLSKTSEFIHGSSHLSLYNSHLSQQTSHYIGFTSPKDQPLRFNALLQDLMNKYTNDGELKNESLLINTPGWVKGYGVNLTRVIIEKIRPTHVVYLHSSNAAVPVKSELEMGGDEVLSLLRDFPDVEVVPIRGSFGYNHHQSHTGVKYHSSQLRILKKLGYFHRVAGFKFDFSPLLNKAPLQLSLDLEQEGSLKMNVILNYNDLRIIEDDGYNSLLEGTIVSLYTITKSELQKLQPKLAKFEGKTPLLKSKDFLRISQSALRFKSLCLVHSVDPESQLVNIYTPHTAGQLTKSSNEEYIFIRGATDTPIMEIASTEMIKKFKKLGYKVIQEYDLVLVWTNRIGSRSSEALHSLNQPGPIPFPRSTNGTKPMHFTEHLITIEHQMTQNDTG
ncbi:hypothetical protein WICPIJ_004462 [Wickerhamomyces pijperi]|uniref:Polynucleotide 5'-hydroxyl-kinase GRC3 n=1 Tax=Wickerhamomyces pijperi TaxID=599730 RepID=A0A9P8Q5B9_WICPI|nr:hypothetical protein WICPIJ_004462 [Wickerhamomyces pijperi]